MVDTEAKLTLDEGTAVEPDVLKGTLGQDAIDIHTLGSKGVFTFDSGFISTASCESKITLIDDDKGILLYRGFLTNQLATGSNYLEVCYILPNGEKPAQKQYDELKTAATCYAMIREQTTRLFHAFRRDSHPMAVICNITGALAALYHDSLDINNPRHREIAAFRLLSKVPTTAAMCYKYSIGQPFVYPCNDFPYAGNFLNMMFPTPYEPYEVNPILERAMDHILILHADHEQNAFISTVRTADSPGANPFARIVAGTASLWGLTHGGTSEAALKMLEEISSVKHIPEFARRAKNKNGPFRLMGFGHCVYEDYSLRATIMYETCHEALKGLDTRDDLLEVTIELEDIALSDPYFIKKKLYPNVDFYSGIILKVMGIPSPMFTVIFAMACTVGWIAHWSEIRSDGMKVAHPRRLYTGYEKCDFRSDIKRQWLIVKPSIFRTRL